MKKRDFQDFSASVGLRVVGSDAYGVVGGFPIALNLNNGALLGAVFSLRPEDAKRMRKPLAKAAEKAFGVNDAGNGCLIITLPAKSGKLEEAYEKMCDIVPAFLRENGVQPTDVCPICDRGGCDSYARVKTGYRAVHRGCIEGLHAGVAEVAEHNDLNGNYFTGIIGGLLGGLLACVPNLLTIWFMESIYSLLYALIPLGVYFGYKKFGGKMNKVSIVVTCVISLALAPVIDVMVVAISFAANGIPLDRIGRLFRGNQFASVMLPEMLKSLIFVALGIYFVWSKISRTAHTEVAEIRDIMETITPIASIEPGRFGQPSDASSFDPHQVL